MMVVMMPSAMKMVVVANLNRDLGKLGALSFPLVGKPGIVGP